MCRKLKSSHDSHNVDCMSLGFDKDIMYWRSYLFVRPNVPPEDLNDIIPEPNEHGWVDSSAFEDLLQNNNVFYNGLRGEDHTCHSDSYMTCVNYRRLEIVLDSVFGHFDVSEARFNGLMKSLEGVNQQIPMRLVAGELRRHRLNKVYVGDSV